MRADLEAEYVAFVETATPTLRRLARSVTPDHHRADDLVQTTLEKLYLAWPRLTRRGELPMAYARTTLVRLPDQPDRATSPETRVDLASALRRLTPRQRLVLFLRHSEDLPADCDGEVVARWLEANLGGVTRTDGLGFAPASSASSLGKFPADTVYLSSAAITEPVASAPDARIEDLAWPDQVDVYITAQGSGSYHWERVNGSEPDGSFDERTVEVADGVTARVLSRDGGDDLTHAMWSVPEGPGHGAVFLEVQSQTTNAKDLTLDDDEIVDLIRLLLED